ncbi:hypothetical protein M2651_10525 [Clostridium sp. SYSU_GA19001]|uniref:hypothetical protein n=1 Tax=Clostridium caldaquaticum TaxID=2940653 RepID=UPI002077441E|nr:hypothetical protein [Clostridium caldaquaticum]MCM8711455.1 hypothetical protein [Clostridium caldaquaticum]
MYEDNFNDFEPFTFDDEDDFFEFTPPFSCPLYRQQFPFPGGGVTPPRPPFGTPGGEPGTPATPPPSFTPSLSQAQSLGAGTPGVLAVDPGALRPCRFRFVYLWLKGGRSFWAYLTFVGRRSVSGFRWNGRRWVYFGVDTRRIDYFICY